MLALVAAAALPWQTATPERTGMDRARLESIQKDLDGRHTTALLVVRRGKVVWERYGPGTSEKTAFGTASLAKAIVGGSSLLLALQDGRLQPDERASRYIPSWTNDARKSAITIRHLATHTSGVEDAKQDEKPHEELPGWKGAFWRREPDPFTIALSQAPTIFDAGSAYHYSNPGMAVLAYAVTASLRGAPQTDIRALLERRLMDPLGIAIDEWRIGYGRAYQLNGLSLWANWGGGNFTARATARIGLLMMQRGLWGNQQVLDRQWVDRVLAGSGMPSSPESGAPASGLGWWVNTNGGWQGVPKDAFGGAGAGHQLLLVVPSLDLVVVRHGQPLGGVRRRSTFWAEAVQFLFRPIVQSVTETTPYPAGRIATSVSFSPIEPTACQAIGSDNWPVTWGDDDMLYAAYGDGWGFEPLLNRKLSLGFVRISGGPANYRGTNIRSESGEHTGEGPKGIKASGMLMVDKVLYMWVRNLGQAQLAWSGDHGKTWQWGWRMEDGFGSPAFVNFGRNYAGARDAYVYTYSQEGSSAYESDDHLLLARVHRRHIRDRAAWEFFHGLDAQGQPRWTSDIASRVPVFRYPRHCQRVDAVYNPALRRYLMALGYDHGGGWGLFEASEPWGPWSTVYHTDNWGLGETHGYRLPSKWISKDGRTLHMIFSGRKPYDAFCTRELKLLSR
jgi:CubicO group peptidase (beta-lactamase class C family)